MMGRTKEITDAAHARYLAERGNQKVILKCLFCDEEITGTFAETKLAAADHRKKQHPEARQRTKLVRNRAGIRTIGTRTLEENVAINRLQGASGWASAEGAMEA
jgi:hypothetical protein